MTSPKHYKYEYFNGRGRGEIPRLVFVAAGVEFEDVRIEFADWPQRKLSSPSDQLPILTISGGGKETVEICQSNAIATYLAKALGTGLYGKSFLDGAIIDEMFGIYKDIFEKVFKIRLGDSDEEKEKAFKSFSEMITKFDRYVGSKLYKNGSRTRWIIGDKMTLADLIIFHFIDMERLSKQDESRDTWAGLQGTSNLMSVYMAVRDDPKIRRWVERRPETQF